MPPLRVVLDNNVVVSALVFPSGRLSWLRQAWQSSALAPIASWETIAELRRVLGYRKFDLSLSRQIGAMRQYQPWCEMVMVGEPPDVPECRDPKDRMFLELAVVGRADALVTGDGDLLELGPVFAIPIVTPAALRCRLERGVEQE
jgi:putative PIN family toxin of toxin-antitoxin system